MPSSLSRFSRVSLDLGGFADIMLIDTLRRCWAATHLVRGIFRLVAVRRGCLEADAPALCNDAGIDYTVRSPNLTAASQWLALWLKSAGVAQG